MADRTYFLIEPGSPVLDVIADAEEKQRAYYAAVEAFCAEFGTKKWCATTNWQVFVRGLVFDGPPPRGWRLSKIKGYCVVSWTVWEKLGERYVLRVPTECKVSPPGCRKLKMSEYWQLKEAADAAKEAVPA